MSVTALASQALLVSQADMLSDQATSASLLSLATTLNNLSLEIENITIGSGGGYDMSPTEFYSYISTWSSMLLTAAEIISSKETTIIANNTTIIANNTTTISNAVINPITRQKITNFTGSINDTVLTVTATSGENVLPGMIISGQDVTPNTKILSQVSGSGKEGTYIVDTAQTISNRQITGAVTLTSEGIAYSLGQAEQHHLKMKELASGIGIRNVTPYDTFSLISIYHLLVEQGKVLDTEGIVDPDKQQQAISKILEFNNILKTFREF